MGRVGWREVLSRRTRHGRPVALRDDLGIEAPGASSGSSCESWSGAGGAWIQVSSRPAARAVPRVHCAPCGARTIPVPWAELCYQSGNPQTGSRRARFPSSCIPSRYSILILKRFLDRLFGLVKHRVFRGASELMVADVVHYALPIKNTPIPGYFLLVLFFGGLNRFRPSIK